MENALVDYFAGLPVVVQALLATLFTWFVTALGAAPVFFVKTLSQRFLDGMLGLAAGVMIAASYFSLLAPAVERADGDWKPATLGFLIGGLFLYGIDKVLPHLHLWQKTSSAEGIHTRWRRAVLLVMAITLHNIPEGLAVGVAFGAVASGNGDAPEMIRHGLVLALGIGLQNFPEGLAVAIPLRREGLSRKKAFLYGQGSGVVEPLAGILGAWLVSMMSPLLPYALAFAAGAMIFVVVEELIPESQQHGNEDFATMVALCGFALMMGLDVGLG